MVPASTSASAGSAKLGGHAEGADALGYVRIHRRNAHLFRSSISSATGQRSFQRGGRRAADAPRRRDTNVVNPDPDRARNPYGSAQITIRVDGPIAGLKVGLTSNPPGYTQEQILGLITPFGGFVGGIGYSRQGMLAQQQPNGITPSGTVSPIPNVGVEQRSTITVGQEAFNSSTRSLPPACCRRWKRRSAKAWGFRASTSRSATTETSASARPGYSARR